MLRRGEVYENPANTIRAVIQVGTWETNGERLVADLDVRRCGAGSALHMHPTIHERLTIVSGRVAVSVNDKTSIAEVGSTIEIAPGVPHRWWNAGIYQARVTIDIQPAARFEEYIRNLFGLAQDGKTDPSGMPHLLQLAVLSQDFSDVIRFVKPARFVPGSLFPAIAPIARLFGYRGSYSKYLTRPPSQVLDHGVRSAENHHSELADSA
ncbi:MAG: cupin domain-containing protein [Acidobacteriaceae bacterium]